MGPGEDEAERAGVRALGPNAGGLDEGGGVADGFRAGSHAGDEAGGVRVAHDRDGFGVFGPGKLADEVGGFAADPFLVAGEMGGFTFDRGGEEGGGLFQGEIEAGDVQGNRAEFHFRVGAGHVFGLDEDDRLGTELGGVAPAGSRGELQQDDSVLDVHAGKVLQGAISAIDQGAGDVASGSAGEVGPEREDFERLGTDLDLAAGVGVGDSDVEGLALEVLDAKGAELRFDIVERFRFAGGAAETGAEAANLVEGLADIRQLDLGQDLAVGRLNFFGRRGSGGDDRGGRREEQRNESSSSPSRVYHGTILR